MGINISISNTSINDDVNILNNATVRGNNNIDVQIEDSEIMGKLELLDESEVDSLRSDLIHDLATWDNNSKEYNDILQLLSLDRTSSNSKFIDALKRYVKEFSQGFLADFLSGWLISHI